MKTNKLAVLYDNDWLEFMVRPNSITDKAVLKEMFVENIYQVTAGDIGEGIIIDLGANIGAFTVYAKKLGAKKLIAYEPDSENYEILLENLELNGVEAQQVHKKGVFRHQATLNLWNQHGDSFIGNTREKVDEATAHEAVEVISLADVYEQNGITVCNILKVDVEGSEYAIFEAAPSDVIAKARYIVMEGHETNEQEFGKILAKLSLTHNIHLIGKYNEGYQIYARRY